MRKKELKDLLTEFDTFVHDIFDSEPLLQGTRLPSGNRMMNEFFLDFASGEFVPWESLIPTTSSKMLVGNLTGATSQQGYGSISNGLLSTEAILDLYLQPEIILTPAIIQQCFLLAFWMKNRQNVLVSGMNCCVFTTF